MTNLLSEDFRDYTWEDGSDTALINPKLALNLTRFLYSW